jgi:hypothetical protein
MNLWLKGNITIPPRPRSVGGLIGWARGVNRALVELRERKIVGNVTTRAASGIKPPLWVTLRTLPGDPITYEVFAEYGHVVPRHNSSTDTGEPIEITSLPTKDAPLAVIEDDKLWVELTIGVDGKCTAADFDSGATWPEDTPPDLVGGDGTGTAGQRYIRIAEIIPDPESTATTPPIIRKQLHTGHIDYAQPTLAENTISSASGNQGRTLKAWNATEGQWEFRHLEAGDGIEITEEADRILVAATGASHPWKSIPSETENSVDVGEGFVMAYYTSITGEIPQGEILVPDTIVLAAAYDFDGDTVEITGTQYIYGEISRNYVEGDYYAASEFDIAGTTETTQIYTHDDINPAAWASGAPSQTVSLVASNDAPSTYSPTSGKAAFLIAKATNDAGTITIDKQYLTHNPTMFVPMVLLTVIN